MDDNSEIQVPERYDAILARSHAALFQMNSDLLTGSLLRTLAASKPSGAFLELGTGAGLGTCWILAGMDGRSSLVSVENDPQVLAIARDEFGVDPRLTLIEADGADFLAGCTERFDFIYADAWPGKYSQLDLALDLVKPGGMFLVDDMLPQPNWPAGHDAKAAELIARLEALPDFCVTKLGWSTGLILCVKR
jgi:predicted O-methyltransferase YrrM